MRLFPAGKRRNIRLLILTSAVLCVLCVYWAVAGRIQLCLFRLMTGLPCPGCGLTHAALALCRGEWKESLRYHPLLLPVLFVLFTALFRKVGIFRILHENRYFYLLAVGALLILYAVRLILYFPGGPVPMVYDPASVAGRLLALF